jgi:hypothetical protein
LRVGRRAKLLSEELRCGFERSVLVEHQQEEKGRGASLVIVTADVSDKFGAIYSVGRQAAGREIANHSETARRLLGVLYGAHAKA